MKNIIPFKKDVIFKTNLSEITSISLENTLNVEKDIVKGEFLISGEYKISDNSTSVEPFELNIPIASAEYGATLDLINDSYIVVLIIIRYLLKLLIYFK